MRYSSLLFQEGNKPTLPVTTCCQHTNDAIDAESAVRDKLTAQASQQARIRLKPVLHCYDDGETYTSMCPASLHGV